MITRDGGFERICGCCGSPDLVRHANGYFSPWRCASHADRNPCAIEGCKRTREAPTREDGSPILANNQTLCREHWKRYVPPRSRVRRAYHAHFRRAERQGWTDKNMRAFDQFWRALVAMARRRHKDGHLDMAEINRIMGWGG